MDDRGTNAAELDMGGAEAVAPPPVTVSPPPPAPVPAAPATTSPPVTPVRPAVCVVPRLGGKTLASARAALVRAHCRLGRVTRRPWHGGRRAAKRVVAQSAKHDRNYAIAVTLR